jgi:enoyl-CoA hydratase/carnithine racemase
MFLTGERVSGRRAYRLGLIDQLVPQSELIASARALAVSVAAGAPLAVEAVRSTLRAQLLGALEEQLALEASEQFRLFQTSDYKEGLNAVHERRPGRWLRA